MHDKRARAGSNDGSPGSRGHHPFVRSTKRGNGSHPDHYPRLLWIALEDSGEANACITAGQWRANSKYSGARVAV